MKPLFFIALVNGFFRVGLRVVCVRLCAFASVRVQGFLLSCSSVQFVANGLIESF